jgi:hypothetical protein
MMKSFIGACLMGVALSIGLRTGIELPTEEVIHSDIFAQTETETGTGIISEAVCQKTAKRNKDAVADFYALYAGTTPYTDTDFAANNEAFAWNDASETY